MHSRTWVIGKWLWHKGGMHPLIEGNFLDDMSESHNVICGAQGIGVSQINLLLSRRTFVMAKFNRDAHCFQHRDCLTAEVMSDCRWGLIEIAARINWYWYLSALRRILKEEELHFGMGVASKSHLRSFVEHLL